MKVTTKVIAIISFDLVLKRVLSINLEYKNLYTKLKTMIVRE